MFALDVRHPGTGANAALRRPGSSTASLPPVETITARSTTLRSSRTLPGQG